MDEAKIVLIVDDDGGLRRLLADILRGSGHNFEILEAETGGSAIEELKRRECDCVLLDYMLPDIDGLHIISMIRDLERDAAIIMLTGVGDETLAVKAMKAGAFDYLPKASITRSDRFFLLIHTILNAIQYKKTGTDRKKIEKVLRKNEERYRGIVDNSPVMIIRFFPVDFSVSFVNQGYCAYFNTTPFDALGENAIELVFGDDRSLFTGVTEGLTLEKPLTSFERFIKSDDDPRYIVWSVQALFDDHGTIWEYQCVGSDITDLKLAEKRRRTREEHERLAETLHAVGIGVITTDTQGRILLINSVAEDLTGWTHEDAVGKYCGDVLAVSDETETGGLMDIQYTWVEKGFEGRGTNLELVLTPKTGRKKNISLIIKPINSRYEGFSGLVLGFMDITEKRILERLFEYQNEFLQSIIDSQENIIIVIDRDRVRMANNRFLDFFGLEPGVGGEAELMSIGGAIVDAEGCLAKPAPGGWTHALVDPGRQSSLIAFKPARLRKPRVFSITVNKLSIDEELYVATLTDVTDLDEKRRVYQHRASHDALTGTFNRTRFDEALAHHVEIARRYDACLSLVFMDIDHFKEINDEFGHQAGDTILKEISRVVRRATRRSDIFARWGGEEFTLLLPHTDANEATLTAEKIRARIETARLRIPRPVTCSFGVAGFMEKDTVETLIRRADEALYLAKNRGRNRVESR
ncbi:MAG: diguanylate cyclase [Spirochaetes bacterium]|nr:MAG: diguanylate cyclase [Spirochaetota bacterium]